MAAKTAGIDRNEETKNKYVSGTDIYPHMPILRPHAARISRPAG